VGTGSCGGSGTSVTELGVATSKNCAGLLAETLPATSATVAVIVQRPSVSPVNSQPEVSADFT